MTDIATEELLGGVYSKRSSMDRVAIQQLSRRQKLSRWIKKLSRMKIKNFDGLKSYREAIEETETFLMDQKVVQKLSRM